MVPPPARAPAGRADRNRLHSLAILVVFDIAGPLAAYALLRKAGLSAVISLVLSGIFPAFGVGISFVRARRLDAVGILVLAGIVVGTVLGLLSGNPRLVLLEGSVPTAVFGLLCLFSLLSPRPLMYRFAIEFIGPDTERGHEFVSLWRFAEFRHLFRVLSIVWGLGFVAEAAVRVVIVELTSTGTALAISKVLPFVVAGLLAAWTFGYGNLSRRRGERRAAQAATGTAQATAGQPGTGQADADEHTGP
ncbi:MAG TPA: VC0807 family protein [Streptosporangiaceae bacterium]